MNEKSRLIGSHLKILRIQRALQQRELAKQIGISQAHLSNIESGRSNLTMENLFKLQELFDCPFSEFFVEVDKAMQKQEPPPPQPSYFSLEDLTTALLAMKKV